MRQQESIQMKGIYKFTKAKIETDRHKSLLKEIERLQESGGDYIGLVRELNGICDTEVVEVENIIPTSGRAVLANNLTSNSPTNDPRINYTALGTDATSPSNSDTALGSESYRKQTASATNSDHVAYVTAFYTADETSGTFTEHALFCDGTASVDSGALFSRVLLNGGSGITKSATETLTIDYQINLE